MCETFEEWKQRAMQNIKNVENINTPAHESFYSDINFKYVNPKLGAAKDNGVTVGVVPKLGHKEDFDGN